MWIATLTATKLSVAAATPYLFERLDLLWVINCKPLLRASLSLGTSPRQYSKKWTNIFARAFSKYIL